MSPLHKYDLNCLNKEYSLLFIAIETSLFAVFIVDETGQSVTNCIAGVDCHDRPAGSLRVAGCDR